MRVDCIYNGMMTTASVTLQTTPFDRQREILSKFHNFFIIVHNVHAFNVLKPVVGNISFDI